MSTVYAKDHPCSFSTHSGTSFIASWLITFRLSSVNALQMFNVLQVCTVQFLLQSSPV